MADIFLSLLTFSECVFPIHEQHNHDMFLPLLTLRKCVFPYHEQHNHGWHVPATFDSQQVRFSLPWAAQLCLTRSHHFWLSDGVYVHFMSSYNHGWHVPATFNYQEVRNFILFTAPLALTCSLHFWLSVGVYFYFMNSTIMPDMFPLLLPLRWCVFPIHELHYHGWHFPPLLTLSWCVCPFHERHNHGWHVPATFNYQNVCNSISFTAPSRLTCSRHF